MATWDDLAQELDAWQVSDRRASFWWRDDDAVRVTPALERLLALSDEAETPVSLAVIPRDADDALRDRLARQPRANVLQHGWSHANHAPEGRQEEFGPHRPLPAMLDELARGWRRIAGFRPLLPGLRSALEPDGPACAVLPGRGGSTRRFDARSARIGRGMRRSAANQRSCRHHRLARYAAVSSACSRRWSKLSRTSGSAARERWTPTSRPA